MVVHLGRRDARSADFAYDGVVGSRVAGEAREPLVHARGNPGHVLIEAVNAQVPAAEDAPDLGLLLTARLADGRDRLAFRAGPRTGSNGFALRTRKGSMQRYLRREEASRFLGYSSSIRPAPRNRDRRQGRVRPLPRPAPIRRERDRPG